MQIFPFIGFIPNLAKIRFDDAFYQHVRVDFNEVWSKGVYKTADENPCLFVLEIHDHHRVSTGLIALSSIQDYLKHSILKHEQTIASKEMMHRGLYAARKAMIKPAALLIRKHTGLHKIMSAVKDQAHPILVVKFPDHQTMQRIWKIDSPKEIKKISNLFQKSIHQAIIADGHHRFASIAHAHSTQTPQAILTAYFAHDEMYVSTFYRMIKKLKSESYQSVLDQMKAATLDWHEVEVIHPIAGIVHLVCQNTIFRFKLKTKSKDPLQLTFSKSIIQKVFNIKDESTSKRIKYAESPDSGEAHRLIMQQHADLFIFILPPLTPLEILNNKKILPPKSTLFTPRIINGLVVVPVNS